LPSNWPHRSLPEGNRQCPPCSSDSTACSPTRNCAGRCAAAASLLAHPASVTADLTHAIDALAALPDLP
jgi:hypothetical protein